MTDAEIKVFWVSDLAPDYIRRAAFLEAARFVERRERYEGERQLNCLKTRADIAAGLRELGIEGPQAAAKPEKPLNDKELRVAAVFRRRRFGLIDTSRWLRQNHRPDLGLKESIDLIRTWSEGK